MRIRELEQACAASLLENIQREDLTPIEEAQAIQRLIREKYCLPCEVTFSENQAQSKVTLTYHSLEAL